MKAFSFALVFLFLFLLPLTALAAPVGWKDAASCFIPTDHGVWSADNTSSSAASPIRHGSATHTALVDRASVKAMNSATGAFFVPCYACAMKDEKKVSTGRKGGYRRWARVSKTHRKFIMSKVTKARYGS